MKLIKEINKKESGQVFILVLILLLLGGFIIGPLMGYMSTGLIVGQVYEERMDELYAADAGVEDALWQIMTIPDELPQSEDDPPMPPYSIEPVNDKEVNPIVITFIDESTYRIESTATSPDTGSSTTIESYINILDFTNFMDNAITSTGTVDLKSEGEKKAMVYDGDVVYCEGDAPSEEQVIAGEQHIDGEVRNECVEGWPTAEQLHAYYWPDVEDSEPFPYPYDTIDVKFTDDIGPLYRDGDLGIESTNKDARANLHFNETEDEYGTVYVKGNLDIGNIKQNFTLDLNKQTIFVEGEIDIGGKCTITGHGCIVGVGDVYFSPKISSDEESFVFVMSVEGTVWFNPQGDFYGSLAGNVDVNLQPGNTLNWSGPPPDLRYPGAEPSDMNVIQSIRTWEISLQ